MSAASDQDPDLVRSPAGEHELPPGLRPTWLQRRLCGFSVPQDDKVDDPPTTNAMDTADATSVDGTAAVGAGGSDDDTEAAKPNPESVQALLGFAQDAVEDERDRGRALDTKTASLVGFTGLVLSVNVTLARPLLDRDLGPFGDVVVAIAAGVAIIALLAALAIGVRGVLMPQGYGALSRKQLREFAVGYSQTDDPTTVSRSMLGALSDVMDRDRPVNDCKAKLTRLTAQALLIGLTAVSAQALTLVLHDLGI